MGPCCVTGEGTDRDTSSPASPDRPPSSPPSSPPPPSPPLPPPSVVATVVLVAQRSGVFCGRVTFWVRGALCDAGEERRYVRVRRRRAPRRARPVPRRPSGASRRARPRAARPHSPRRPAARAPRASRAERAGGESACQCIVELRARRAPRQPAPRTSGRAARHPASAQLAINCRWPARQRPTTLRLCGSGAAQLVARRPICTWWAIHTPAACRPRGTGSR